MRDTCTSLSYMYILNMKFPSYGYDHGRTTRFLHIHVIMWMTRESSRNKKERNEERSTDAKCNEDLCLKNWSLGCLKLQKQSRKKIRKNTLLSYKVSDIAFARNASRTTKQKLNRTRQRKRIRNILQSMKKSIIVTVKVKFKGNKQK